MVDLHNDSTRAFHSGAVHLLSKRSNSSVAHPQSLVAAFGHALSKGGTLLQIKLLEFPLVAVKALEDALSDAKGFLRQGLLAPRMNQIKDWISRLDDPECPDMGTKFNQTMRRANIKTVIDSTISNSANYTSYSYSKGKDGRIRGFINEMAINPAKMDDPYAVFSGVAHEPFHGFQKLVSFALQHSPFNPETRVMIHPLDWILVERLCEMDGYTKQAWFNSRLSQIDPAARANSSADPVSVDEFEAIRNQSADLQETLTRVALQAVKKDYTKGDSSFSFGDWYNQVAINNFKAGLKMREKAGEKKEDFVFVRLTPQDFWEIGNYAIGPNPFGEKEIDPAFLQRTLLKPYVWETFLTLAEKYNIDVLDNCPTLKEYVTSHPSPKKANASVVAEASTKPALEAA